MEDFWEIAQIGLISDRGGIFAISLGVLRGSFSRSDRQSAIFQSKTWRLFAPDSMVSPDNSDRHFSSDWGHGLESFPPIRLTDR